MSYQLLADNVALHIELQMCSPGSKTQYGDSFKINKLIIGKVTILWCENQLITHNIISI